MSSMGSNCIVFCLFQVEIKRTIPKGSVQSSSKDFKTKKIFVGGLPSSLTEDDFKNFFVKYGSVVDHQIMRDHETKRSRGFGFIVFASEQVVNDLLANGNMIDLADSKVSLQFIEEMPQMVEIKKAEPKKSSNPPPLVHGRNSRSAYDSDSRDHPSADNYGGLASVYVNYRGGGFDPYRRDEDFGGRLGSYGGLGEFGGGYGRYYPGIGGYGDASSFGYPNRLGLYGGFHGAYAGGDLSGYRPGGADESFGGLGSSAFGGSVYGGAYDSALGSFGSGSTPDRNRGSFTGRSGRYQPYG
ncbi:glycine-rich RNA-binding protein 2-like isoform X2 [Phragmites australis]|uniref:glycine-rich RNA-binding protein 2-like isoform X2 n=1 Tax=Phragmites australis TaxID=29695 RepID=UPI002D7912C9|nr:glycine-rich RNA-binding protein 2-like isoform X2 [Phragmites australis]